MNPGALHGHLLLVFRLHDKDTGSTVRVRDAQGLVVSNNNDLATLAIRALVSSQYPVGVVCGFESNEKGPLV